MERRDLAEPYQSLLEFYFDAYGQHITESHSVGRTGAGLLSADQTAGDWSDAATPDLVVCRLVTKSTPMTMNIGGGVFRTTMQKNNFIVVPPSFASTILVDGAHHLELIALNFRHLISFAGDPDESGLPEDGDFGPLHCSTHQDVTVSALMDRLWAETRAGNPNGALGADGLVLQIMGALVRLRDARPVQARGGLSSWQVRRVCDYIEDQLAEDISLADLAALVGLSPHHFCRAFATSLGAPPHRWRMGRRLVRARDLLETTMMSVTEIAADCGFASSQHFAAAFRKSLGVSPTAYRQDRRGLQ